MKPIIGIDIDSVLYDLIPAFRAFMVEETGRSPESFPNPTMWNFASEWGLADRDFWRYFDKFGLTGGFRKSVPLDGIEKAIEIASEFGNVHIVTARGTSNASTDEYVVQVRVDTLNWLMRYGLIGYPLHFVQNKTLVKMDYLIDDSPKNLADAKAAGIHAVAIDYPYNAEVDVPRFKTLEAAVIHIRTEHARIRPTAS